MLNTKLFKLLRHLSSEEMKAVKVYLNSKHSKAAKAFRLFDYIDKNRHDLEGNKTKFTKEKIYKHVYGKEAYNQGKMHELASRLLKELEFYLILEELGQDELLYNVILSRVFKKRGMDDLFKLHNDKSQKKILKNKTLEHQHFHALAQLSQDATFHRDTPKLKAEYEARLKQTERYIDIRYLLDKLRMMCIQNTADGIINIKGGGSLILIDIERLNEQLKGDDSLAKLYLNVLEMYKNGDGRMYKEIKAKITNMGFQLFPENRYNLLILLINYASKEYKENKVSYRNEMIQLYEFALDKQLLLEDGYISDINYRNAINLFIGAGKYDIAKKIIKQSDQLPPAYQKDFKAISQARLSYAQGEYGETIRILNDAGKLKMLDISYKLTARNLLLRAYYEEIDYNTLDDYAKASLVFIKRHEKELSENTCEANRNFYKFVQAIAKLKHKKGKIIIYEIKQYFDDYSPIVHIHWCRKKIEELQNT